MKLPAHVIRQIAVQAHRDPRTVERFLEGKRARPLAEADIREAMRELEIELSPTTPREAARAMETEPFAVGCPAK